MNPHLILTLLFVADCLAIYALIWLWPKRRIQPKDKVYIMTAFGWREI